MIKEAKSCISAFGAIALLVSGAHACQARTVIPPVQDINHANNYFDPIFSDVEPIGLEGMDASYQLFRSPSKRTGPHNVLYAHSKNHRYRLVVEVNGKRLFETEFKHGMSLEREDAVKIEDLNQDGFKDIQILGGFNKGQPWYKVWKFDPARKNYIWGG